MPSKPFNIVYASSLTIQDPSLLATLAVFYDKVSLPHAYDLDPDARPLIRWPMKYIDDLEWVQKDYQKWKDRWRLLFEAGIFEVLPPAFQSESQEPTDLQERLLTELGIQTPFFGSSDIFDGRVALAMHALFARTSDPEFFLRRPSATDTNHLRDALATSLIQYRMPIIGELNPEQILQIRKETAPYKEGLIYYLNQLTDKVENRLKDTAGDEREAALRTIEREIIPELEEHLRQQKLLADKIRVNTLESVAKGIGTVIGIALSPWNLTNYTGVLELFLKCKDSSLESKLQQAPNKHRAFQFLSSMEKAAKV